MGASEKGKEAIDILSEATKIRHVGYDLGQTTNPRGKESVALLTTIAITFL